MLNPNRQLDSWGPVDGVILYTGFWLLPTAGLSGDRWGEYWPELVGLYERARVSYYWEKAAIETQGAHAIIHAILPDSRRHKLWRAYQKRLTDLRVQAKKISRVTARTPLNTVARSAGQWYETLVDTWSLTNVFELANFAAPAWLRKKISSFVPKDEIDSALEILLAPTRLSFHQQSELELLRLLVAGSGRTLQPRLTAYSQQWHWLANNYYESKKLTASYFHNQVRHLTRAQIKLKIKEIENYTRGQRAHKRQIIKKYSLPPAIAKMADTLAFSIWWQDQRKAVVLWSHTYLDILTRWASQHWHLNFKDILYYTAEEWRDLFTKQALVPGRVIRDRKKFCVVHMHDSRFDIYTGARAKRVMAPILRAGHAQNNRHPINTVSGTAVSRSVGLVTGRVRLLKSAREINKMRSGEILVAPMTSPDYIVAMRKARAIITDVGGLMSHAAIVSRELGIPAVVGTKVATQVLRDGDWVEVDAGRGIVRKM